MEWWYFSGHLLSSAQKRVELGGFEINIARISPAAGPLPGNPSFILLQMAVTDLKSKFHAHEQLLARERPGITEILFDQATSKVVIRLPGTLIELDTLQSQFKLQGLLD